MLNFKLNIAPKKSDKKEYLYDYSHMRLGMYYILF
jgi:hypothetical protein